MSLTVYKYTCKNGHVFEAANAGESYGVFVVRGEVSPMPGRVDGFGDPVFTEVNDLLREMGAYEESAKPGGGSLLQAVFGATCDPAPDGTQLRIDRNALCPECGTREMWSWTPVRGYEGPTLNVTHEAWSHLSKTEKMALLTEAVANIRDEPGIPS